MANHNRTAHGQVEITAEVTLTERDPVTHDAAATGGIDLANEVLDPPGIILELQADSGGLAKGVVLEVEEPFILAADIDLGDLDPIEVNLEAYGFLDLDDPAPPVPETYGLMLIGTGVLSDQTLSDLVDAGWRVRTVLPFGSMLYLWVALLNRDDPVEELPVSLVWSETTFPRTEAVYGIEFQGWGPYAFDLEVTSGDFGGVSTPIPFPDITAAGPGRLFVFAINDITNRDLAIDPPVGFSTAIINDTFLELETLYGRAMSAHRSTAGGAESPGDSPISILGSYTTLTIALYSLTANVLPPRIIEVGTYPISTSFPAGGSDGTQRSVPIPEFIWPPPPRDPLADPPNPPWGNDEPGPTRK